MFRNRIPAWMLALATAAFIVAVNNHTLFAALQQKLPLATAHGLGYATLLVWLMTGSLFLLFLLLGVGRLLKPVLIAGLVLSAALGYFTNQLGVVFDLEMMRNLAETAQDGNLPEALELLSWPLAVHLMLLGVLPAACVVAQPLRQTAIPAEVGTRIACSAAVLAMTALLILPNYKFVTYFSVENRDLRYEITPTFPLLSLAKFVKRRHKASTAEFRVLGDDARLSAPLVRPRVGIMVVGETARADHFSLGGYARRTNPMLEAEPGVMYFDISSCGTSTAFSVPCMFSMRDQDTYSPRAAKSESNVLDILTVAGVHTVWIDNNSSCKGVCERIDNENLRNDVDTDSPWYSDGGYYDAVLLDELDRYLENVDGDLLIVLHMLGSHGPAYSRRYPSANRWVRTACTCTACLT